MLEKDVAGCRVSYEEETTGYALTSDVEVTLKGSGLVVLHVYLILSVSIRHTLPYKL